MNTQIRLSTELYNAARIASVSAHRSVGEQVRAVLELATKAVWLEDGHVKMIGNPEEVVAAYEAH